MQPTYSPETDEFRSKITAFLDANLPEGWAGIGALAGEERSVFQKQWRATLREHNLLAAAWPAEYGGGGLTHVEQVILNEEFAKRGVPTAGANDPFSIGMVGNTILVWGTEEQKAHYIPRILDGVDVFCQGYSEPDAGSDLANVGCKAELDGDEWVISGQKIWTSAGSTANMIFTLARTAPENPKHKGITFLLVPMDQPGVEVRPITNMAGHDHFCEVFFDEARCPKGDVLGEVNNGWAVGNTLLGFERGVNATVTSLAYGAEFEQYKEMVVERGLADDPVVRQDVARFHTNVQIMRYRGMQALTRFLKGQNPGPESSIGKLFWSQHHQAITESAMNVLGADGTVGFGTDTRGGLGAPPIGTPNTAGNWMASFMIARPGTIYAGTSEVQRNIVGERVLGLPKEPRADAGPWKDTK